MKTLENKKLIKATSPLRTKINTFFPQSLIQTQNYSHKFKQDENICIFISNFIKET
jgi:hypothetical protein